MKITNVFRAIAALALTLVSLPAFAQCLDWRQETTARVVGHSIAHDTDRGFPVMFGGYTGNGFLNTTAEWDGAAWRVRKTVNSPSPRAGAMMAYDSTRKVVVLFGGDSDGFTYFNDTWEYNGINWTLKSIPGAKPATRTEGAMVYDAARGVIVLFGGQTDVAQYGDTWEYNGSTWTQVPTSGPTARFNHAMVYDSINSRTLLFGGWALFANNETWSYDGSSWTQLAPTTFPPHLYAHAAAFDPTLGAMVVNGGINSSYVANPQTWAFDGTNWSLSTSAQNPAARAFHAMTYDHNAERIVMHGGIGTDTWTWSFGNWTRADLGMPGVRTHGAFTYDTNRDVAVLYGGYNGNASPELWEWDGRAWSLRSSSGGPGGVFATPMDFHSGINQSVIAVGGTDSNMDTWGWDGSAWNLLDSNGPPNRGSHFLAYDPARDRLVVFGGNDNTGNLGDTWEWDGSSWTLASTTGPSPRWSGAMVYSPAHGGIVLYGGTPGSPTYADTWVWNGTVWTEIAGANQPGPRVGHVMTYHAARGSVVLFGGPFVNTAWELVGTAWVSIPHVSTPPSGRWLSMMCYDPNAQQALLFGGSASGSPGWQNDLWGFGSPVRVVHNPKDARADLGETVKFTVTADGQSGLTYRWRKNGVDLSNGSGVSGATTRTLTLTPNDLDDYTGYSCAVTGSCGTIVSAEAQLRSNCAADFNLDGEADILDLLDFLDSFGQCEGQPAPCAPLGIEADLNGDTIIDIVDFLDFLDAFGTGCD